MWQTNLIIKEQITWTVIKTSSIQPIDSYSIFSKEHITLKHFIIIIKTYSWDNDEIIKKIENIEWT
jgi:hypothetical protein